MQKTENESPQTVTETKKTFADRIGKTAGKIKETAEKMPAGRMIRYGLAAVLVLFLVIRMSTGREETPPVPEPVETTVEEEPLTERQAEILARRGEGSSYSALSDRQKAVLSSIEDMLDYLDSSFGEVFHYYDYAGTEPGTGDEWILAYREGKPEPLITVQRITAEDGVTYLDDYIKKTGEYDLEETFSEGLKEIMPDTASYLVRTELYKLNGKGDSVVSRAEAKSWIAVTGIERKKEAEISEMVRSFADYVLSFGGKKKMEFIFLIQNKPDYVKTTYDNIKGMSTARAYNWYVRCVIAPNREVTVTIFYK